MAGGVTNYQMTENAKMRTMIRRGMLITSAEVFYIGEFAEADIAIKRIRTRVEAATTGASAIIVGDGVLSGSPDPNSLVEAGVIATGSVEGEEDIFTLASTLKNTNIKEAHGFPVVLKGSPIYMTCDATPSAGTIAIIIDFYPLDEKNY